MKLFGIDIAKEVNKALGASLLPATLGVVTAGDRSPGLLAYGRNSQITEYTCRGLIEEFEDKQIDGDLVRIGDRRVLLLGASISGGAVMPKPGDEITIEDEKYNIVKDGVRRDPAAATYSCHVRR